MNTTATPQRTTRRRLAITAASVVLAVGTALWGLYYFVTDRGRFERELNRIRAHPERSIGRQVDIATFYSAAVSSRYIAATVDKAYADLSRAFSAPAKTYFSDCGDMPTQETIWQFPGYFVRLYATSALECDGAAIGVFSGTYEEFRGKLLTADVEPSMRFSLIHHESPKRFLYPDR